MKKLSSPIKLIEDSFKIFFAKQNFLYFMSVYFILVPFQVFQFFQGLWIDPTKDNIKFTPIVWFVLAVNIVYLVAYVLVSVAGITAIKRVVDKESLSFKETITFSWKKLLKFLLLSILLFLIISGGSILLIIPGIIFAVWFAFAKYIFIDQKLGVMASIGKSRKLIKGRFWGVSWRLFVILLFAGLCWFTILAIPYGIGSVIITLAGALFMLPSYLLYKELSA